MKWYLRILAVAALAGFVFGQRRDRAVGRSAVEQIAAVHRR